MVAPMLFALSCVLWVATLSWVIYCGIAFNQWQNHGVYAQRRPTLLAVYYWMILIVVLLERPIALLWGNFYADMEWVSWLRLGMSLLFFTCGFLIFSWQALWHQYYDINRIAQEEAIKWQQVINHETPTRGSFSWFIRNKERWGDPKKVGMLTTSAFIVAAVPAWFLMRSWGVGFFLEMVGVSIPLTLFAVSGVIMLRRLQFSINTIALRKGFQWNVTITVAAWLLEVISVFTRLFEFQPFVSAFISTTIGWMILVGFSHLQFIYPSASYIHDLKHRKDKTTSQSTSESASTPQSCRQLVEIFQNTHDFHSLMAHLESDICLENMIFIIEHAQIRNFVRQRSKKNVPLSENILCDFTNYPIDLPRSDIFSLVEESKRPSYNTYRVFYGLFEKFISTAASREVNIPSQLRSALYNVFRGENMPEMHDPFDSALNEKDACVSHLMAGDKKEDIDDEIEKIQQRATCQEIMQLFEDVEAQIEGLIEDSLSRLSRSEQESESDVTSVLAPCETYESRDALQIV